MSSKQFLAAIRSARETKNLDTVLVGSGAPYMGEGVHDVVIEAVDSSKIGENMLTVTFKDEAGKQFKDRAFLMGRDNDFSYSVKLLWSGCLPSKEAIDTFFKEFESGNDEAFNMLTGMKLRLTLGYGKGFIVKVSGAGTYAAYDRESGEQVADEKESIQEAQDAAVAKGLKRAFMRINRVEATHSESNIEAFNAAVEARKQAKTSASSGVGSQFGAGTKAPSFI